MNPPISQRSQTGKADPVLDDLLADFANRLENGETVNVEGYAAEHPERAADLRRLLPAMQVLADLKSLTGGEEKAADGKPLPGVLGDFRLLREVGRGGMGIVYEAEQISLDRRVALKVLPFAATMDARHLKRFQNEARAAAGLHHTNIVPVHFVGCERGVHYYAMQFIDGQDLASVIRASRPPEPQPITAGPVMARSPDRAMGADRRSPAAGAPGDLRSAEVARSGDRATTDSTQAQNAPAGQAAAPAALPGKSTLAIAGLSTERSPRSREHFRTVARLGIQAAEALDFAHQQGIVHRDIKPANLLVDADGRLWVTDFGLAQFQTDAGVTMTGDLVGTIRYMSPEQALAKRVIVDHRTDIYSLGVTLYELLILEPAFKGGDRHELLRQIAFEEPRRPRLCNKAIPQELETILLKAMEKNPADRYATAQELADDLERFVKDEPIRARRPSLPQRLGRWCRRHQPIVWSAAVALAVVLATLAGTIGWVARDQGMRRTEAERVGEAALQEAIRLQQQEKWPEALAAIRRAQDATAESCVNGRLQEQIDERARDLEMVLRLEDIRLGGVEFGGGSYNAMLREAFVKYGINVDLLGPEVAARRIQASSIPMQIAAALDWWAYMRVKDEVPGSACLVAVARLLDPDPWRNRLRDMVAKPDAKAIDKIVAAAQHEELPPATANLLADLVYWFIDEPSVREQAVTVLRKVQRRYPSDLWLLHQIPMLFDTIDGNPDIAKPEQVEEGLRYRTASVALRPQSCTAHNLLGMSLAAKGLLEEAVWEYRGAIRLNADFYLAYGNLGSALSHQNKHTEAIAAYRKLIDLRPNSATAHYNLGNTLHEQGKLTEAITEFREAIHINKDYAQAHCNLAGVLRDQGRFSDALAEIKKGHELGSAHSGWRYPSAQWVRKAERLVELAAKLPKMISGEIQRDDAVLYDFLGTTLVKQGKDKIVDATAAFRNAVELKPDFAEAYGNLGHVLTKQNKLPEAIAACRKAIELKPDFALAYERLGGALLNQGNVDEAALSFRKAINIDKDNAFYHFDYGAALYEQEKLAEAAAEFREAIKIDKDYAAAHFHYATWLYRQGKLAEAMDELRETLRINKDFGEAHRGLAAVLCKLGRYAEALPYAERASNLGSARKTQVASIAMHAGTGQGKDAGSLDPQQQAGFRKKALTWLRAELSAGEAELQKDPVNALRSMGLVWRLQQDQDFNGVRGTAALAKLPEAERHEWEKLWEHVDATIAVARKHVAQAGGLRNFVDTWLVLSEPLPYPGDNRAVALGQQQIPGEALLRPRTGDRVQVNGKALAWKEHHSADLPIDFASLYGRPCEYRVAYAVCYIHADMARSDLVLRVGSEDRAKVYLNGKEVYRFSNTRPLLFDQDEVPITLRPGSNVLVFKVVNEVTFWAGSLHVVAKDGRPAEGIRFGLEPE